MSFTRKNLPKYTLKDEIWNSITHGIGFLFSVGILIFFFIKEVSEKIPFSTMWYFYFYALTMMIVFGVSTLYHSSKFDTKRRVVLRVIDHSDIYLFVAGTYFPICMLGTYPTTLGLIMAIVEFACALFGILVNIIPHNSKVLRYLGFAMYILQGWMLLIFLPFGAKVAVNVFWPILIGGIIYSIGAITYGIGKKKIYFHTIFHVFVVVAALVQFVGIFNLLP